MRLTRQSGVSLVEVLTAVVVLALGVIGAAGLQWQALRAAQEASWHSAASRIAADLAESMRAYHDWSLRHGGANPFAGFAYDSASGPAASPQDCFGAACTPAQFAAFELGAAATRIRELLPGGRVLVCRDANPWDSSSQALRWGCDGSEATAAPLLIKVGWRSRLQPTAEDIPPMLVLAVP